ncbi:hypothetical protein GCM10025794_00440 [Massilia kyonggiensis]|nr:DUF4041 domain-containing protein [Massilia kyonggiensis]
MSVTLLIVCLILVGLIIFQRQSWIGRLKTVEAEYARQKNEHDTLLQKARDEFQATNEALQTELKTLEPFAQVRDAARKAQELRMQASEFFANAKADAQRILQEAKESADAVIAAAKAEASSLKSANEATVQARRQEADNLVKNAGRQADDIIRAAKTRAEEIAGDAYKALNDADALKQLAAAMRNVVDGYGDRYLKPTTSLIDDLADEYGHEDAGRQLRIARERSKRMVENHEAATCDYAEASRRETAIRFVIDAFNGRVDSILSRVKSDNFGVLEQQTRDAYALVNHNGTAFRNARIQEKYLTARLDELRYAAMAHALRERDKEEQRQIREQMREEEKARKEIEKALKDAAKEEEAIQKAMARVQAQVEKANDEQRAAFEAQLSELRTKLAEAESRGQRALSMAQQTKAGHVYVISNIGSFGEHVYKLGMTRRLEPLDRVKELGDASVPFSFDVHAMIWSEDAPRLESQLHKVFVRNQVNKVNPRKEFFRVPLSDIRTYLDQQGVNVSWTMAAAAAEYRESLELEKRLIEDSVAADQWVTHQIEAADAQQLSLVDAESAE